MVSPVIPDVGGMGGYYISETPMVFRLPAWHISETPMVFRLPACQASIKLIMNLIIIIFL